jgi:hypothetical protein
MLNAVMLSIVVPGLTGFRYRFLNIPFPFPVSNMVNQGSLTEREGSVQLTSLY